jgi:hypothetical protein
VIGAGEREGGTMVVAAAGRGSRGEVRPPTMRAVAEGAREMVVPETVMGGPPGARVWPATRNWVCAFAVMVWVPIVIGRGVAAAGDGVSGAVILPMMRAVAEGAREMVVPATTMGAPPGTRVWVPRT